MMPSSIFEIQIPACVDGAELSGLLACPMFLGLWEQEGILTIYWQGNQDGLLQEVQEALVQLDVTIPISSCQLQRVIPRDWNAEWGSFCETDSDWPAYWHSSKLGHHGDAGGWD